MTSEQRAALLVLRDQIADQIDGAPSSSYLSRWCELADFALGEAIDPWALLYHSPVIRQRMKELKP